MFQRVYIEITNACNMSCSFCIKNTRKTRVMTTNEFRYIVNEVKPYTKHVYLHVLGEPTSHPHIIEFLDILLENDMYANITTNGTLLNDKFIHKAIRKISVSLHSIEKYSINDNQKYLDNVKEFLYKASSNKIICEIRLWNIDDDYSKNLVLPTFNITEDTTKINDYLFLGTSHKFEWPSLDAPLTNKDVYCHGLKRQLAILVDGSVVPCCLDSKGDINLGNIHTTSLGDILSSKKVSDIITGFNNRKPVEELCKRCGFATKF